MLYPPIIFAVVLFSSSGDASAQKKTYPPLQSKIEELPAIPVDTVGTADPKTKIILYSNNTWSYFRSDLSKYDELPVFRQNWDTVDIFAYRNIELADLPATIDLRLCDSAFVAHPPVNGSVLSKYGPRRRRNHNGVDIPLKKGEPVCSAFDGKVRYARYNAGGFGYLVIVRHENGLETWHAHLCKLNVKANDHVKAGQVIGFAGSTGRSRGNHLHFEIRYCDQTFDPEFLFDFQAGRLRNQTFALHKNYFNIRSRASEMLEDADDDLPLPGALLAGTDADGSMNNVGSGGNTVVRSAASPAKSANTIYHVVKQGDILGKLAMKYGVSVSQICRLNNITQTTILRIGRSLRIQ